MDSRTSHSSIGGPVVGQERLLGLRRGGGVPCERVVRGACTRCHRGWGCIRVIIRSGEGFPVAEKLSPPEVTTRVTVRAKLISTAPQLLASLSSHGFAPAVSGMFCSEYEIRQHHQHRYPPSGVCISLKRLLLVEEHPAHIHSSQTHRPRSVPPPQAVRLRLISHTLSLFLPNH